MKEDFGCRWRAWDLQGAAGGRRWIYKEVGVLGRRVERWMRPRLRRRLAADRYCGGGPKGADLVGLR